jgi:hypothetical protein
MECDEDQMHIVIELNWENLFLGDGCAGDSWIIRVGRRISPVAWSPSTPRAV